MSGYSHRPPDRAVLLAALLVPFLVALALVPFRTGLPATHEALIMVAAVVAVAALGTRAIVSQLAVRVQRLRTAVVADASHLSSLQGTARLVEDGGSPEAVVEYVRLVAVEPAAQAGAALDTAGLSHQG
ncbi:hypothetical protein ACWGF3_08370 [Streptomyces xanthophaeus]|uniref:hypothetical protein n=1 Tax=Streptomyces xanthophaeus TaxID=67385 RepID=UPI0004CCBF5F|nr:hypothetical protein [Streptomyces xanthophaeus]